MKDVFKSIKIDWKLNSFKSFMILFFYRIIHICYRKNWGGLVRIIVLLRNIVFILLGIDAQISYKAEIGNYIRLLHSGMGVVISAKAYISDYQTIYHQVTFGINENLAEDRQKIVVHENCYFSVGSKIISAEIGKNSKVGPNAVVWHDLPENSLYVSCGDMKR